MQKITNDLKLTTGGLLEFMALKILSTKTLSTKELYKDLQNVGMRTPLGSLYPLLSKLRRVGFVRTGYEEKDKGLDGYKTFDITPKGRERLDILRADWKRLNALIVSL